MNHSEFTFQTEDRLTLQGCAWEPQANPKGAVCLVHGFGEHAGRYAHMAEAFCEAGYALLAFDLRGHGRSEGRRGDIPGYRALMNDVSTMLEQVTARYSYRPLFMYGHSLGGNIAMYHVLNRRPDVAGLIVSAPLLRLAVKPQARKITILRILRYTGLNLSIPSGLDVDGLSRDPEIVKAYRSDPLVHGRITPRLSMSMLRKGRWIMQHADQFPIPLLLMHGEADRITSVVASVNFSQQAAHKCTLMIWDGMFHELHNEPEQQQVFAYVLKWMNLQKSGQ